MDGKIPDAEHRGQGGDTRRLRAAAGENPEAEVIVHVLQFADRAAWVGEPEEVGKFEWQDLGAGGLRAMGDALAKVADQLTIPLMPRRGLPRCWS